MAFELARLGENGLSKATLRSLNRDAHSRFGVITEALDSLTEYWTHVSHRQMRWIAYFVVVLAMCGVVFYPVYSDFDGSVFGIGHDNIGTLWTIWTKQMVLAGKADFEHFTLLNLPKGIDLSAALPMPTADALQWLAAGAAQSAIASFNGLLVAKYSLVALAMGFFLEMSGIPFIIAAISGFFFAFGPYQVGMGRAYGPALVCFAIPLSGIGLHLVARRRTGSIVLGLVAITVAMLENYYVSFFVIVCASFPLLFLVGSRNSVRTFLALKSLIVRIKNSSGLSRVVAALALAVAAAAGYVLAVSLAPHVLHRKFSIAEAVTRSLHISDYLVPPVDHALFGKWSNARYWQAPTYLETYERAAYLGYSLVFLVVCGLLLRQRMETRIRSLLHVVVAMMILSMSLALGPAYPMGFGHDVPGANMAEPHVRAHGYFLFALAPMFRFFSRYHFVTSFSLIVGAAIGFYTVLEQLRVAWQRRLFSFVILVGVSIEYAPYGNARTLPLARQLPAAYRHLIEQRVQGGVLALPSRNYPERVHHRGYQTVHQLPMAGDELTNYPTILSEHEQKRLFDSGIRWLVVQTVDRDVTTFPIQARFQKNGLPYFPHFKGAEHLRLREVFTDSLLFELVSASTKDEVQSDSASELGAGELAKESVLEFRERLLLEAPQPTKGRLIVMLDSASANPVTELRVDGEVTVFGERYSGGVTHLVTSELVLQPGPHTLSVDASAGELLVSSDPILDVSFVD